MEANSNLVEDSSTEDTKNMELGDWPSVPRGAPTVGAEPIELATEVDPAEEEPERCHLMIQYGFLLQTTLMCPSLPHVLRVPEKLHSEARCDFPHLKQIKPCPGTGRINKEFPPCCPKKD